MAYRRDRSIREVYEERFKERVVSVNAPYQRVVSIERRAPFPTRTEDDYDRGDDYEGQRYVLRGYPVDDQRGYHGEDQRVYHDEDQRGYHSESMHIGNERRTAPHHYKRDEQYPYYRGPREDPPTGRQVEFRSSSQVAAPSGVRGQRPPPPRSMSTPSGDDTLMQAVRNLDRLEDHEGPRRKGPGPPVHERSPAKRDIPPSPHSRSGSSISSRSYSPDPGKSYSYPNQQKKRYEEPYGSSRESERERPSSYMVSASQDGSPYRPSLVLATKEDIPGLGLDQDGILKEDLIKGTDDFQERRAQAIAGKALEIEKLYRQDCETFGTVVKMLVSKEPGLEKQLQGPLRDSLVEMRERCLEDLRLYIDELDELMLKQDTATST
ncbi:periphilin-1-like isoform X2 [Alosa sapidissima]|uniref:periphilin-1-like isoform X2 n=1 Tax=Alosa sapidissima TaxID=34773 RepID=UPI001C09A5A0|nr:periphilin-1-like isoform X2 [Alosa sapidissima]